MAHPVIQMHIVRLALVAQASRDFLLDHVADIYPMIGLVERGAIGIALPLKSLSPETDIFWQH